MKGHVGKIEGELDVLRNKKVKGPPKKQKEKQGVVSNQLSIAKKLKERIEEVTNSIEHLEPL
jgi:hypothetical protein